MMTRFLRIVMRRMRKNCEIVSDLKTNMASSAVNDWLCSVRPELYASYYPSVEKHLQKWVVTDFDIPSMYYIK